MPNKFNFPPRLQLAQLPTPLQLLPRATERWGHGKRLWIKRDDLTGSTLTGNKVRKLEFIAAHAKANGIDTLITCGGLQSNHARATAGICAQLGLRCVLVLRGEHPEYSGNTLLDQLFGATVLALRPSDYKQRLNTILADTAAEQSALGHKPLVIPTGGSNGLGIWGYIAGAEELCGDLDRHGIDNCVVVTATGSGGTQAGLTLGMAVLRPQVDVVGMAVCDDAEWFNKKVVTDVDEARSGDGGIPSVALRPITIDRYIGDGYGLARPEVYRLIADLAALEGIVLDPVYTGKAFLGLISELAKGQLTDAEDVVFVHTGGIFGLFPHSRGLAQVLTGRAES